MLPQGAPQRLKPIRFPSLMARMEVAAFPSAYPPFFQHGPTLGRVAGAPQNFSG